MSAVNVHFARFSDDSREETRGTSQMNLFQDAQDMQNFNVVYEVKRQIRLALSESRLSRDQVVDEVNRLAGRDGSTYRTITKAALDSWCKDSDPSRMPGLNCLVILCRVLGTLGPINAMLGPLGAQAIDGKEAGILAWGRAEMERRQATKKARIAAEALNL